MGRGPGLRPRAALERAAGSGHSRLGGSGWQAALRFESRGEFSAAGSICPRSGWRRREWKVIHARHQASPTSNPDKAMTTKTSQVAVLCLGLLFADASSYAQSEAERIQKLEDAVRQLQQEKEE